jgi:cytochrome P450
MAAQSKTWPVAALPTAHRTLCSWMLYNVARHQDVQAKIKDELAAAGLLHVPGKPAPVPVDWPHLGALPYLNVVIKESLRSHTTAATGTAR